MRAQIQPKDSPGHVEHIDQQMEGNDADEPRTGSNVLKQLSWTREQVERAREVAVQSWLASMPLAEELEKLRADLAAAKARLAATAAEIPPLKSAIESTNSAAAARQAEAARKQAAEDELRRRVDGARAELHRVRAEAAAARSAKDAMERRVLVRRQAARALQLAELAVAAETHALAWAASAADELVARAGGYGDGDEDDGVDHHDVVTLPALRMEELRGAVEAEEREADARVEEAEARRRAAKARRAAAVARLDAARARRREADAELGRRVDAGQGGHGKRGSRVPSRMSRTGRSFAVKKLRSFLCNAGKA